MEDPDLGVTLPQLRDALNTKQAWFLDRFYGLLRSAWSGDRICSSDLGHILLHFLGQCEETKVFFLFTLFDKDDSGKLSCTELR